MVRELLVDVVCGLLCLVVEVFLVVVELFEV